MAIIRSAEGNEGCYLNEKNTKYLQMNILNSDEGLYGVSSFAGDGLYQVQKCTHGALEKYVDAMAILFVNMFKNINKERRRARNHTTKIL